MRINRPSAWLGLRTSCATSLLVLWALASSVQAQFNYATVNGTIAITGYSGPDGAVVIPETIDGLPVTSIGDYAFKNLGGIASVSIPNGVTSIGYQAFYMCASLTNVTVPNTVTNIGQWAFTFCQRLTSVTIPEGVPRIGDLAFFYCVSLTSVTIPSSVTSIGIAAFTSCGSLTNNITIPSTVTNIGVTAFSYCTNLGAITVDALNPAYSSLDGVLFNKSQTQLLQCPGAKAGSYTIPDTVTSIASYAFAYCTNVSIGTLPNGVTTIGDWAFYFCASLASVAIPANVTSIGNKAFSGCASLSAITVDPLNSAYSSADGALLNKSQTLLIQCPGGKIGTYTIPNTVTGIGDSAFAYCAGLSSVTIPNGVTSIADYAFHYCTSLTDVAIPGSVTSIGTWTFFLCANLNAVTVDPLNPVYSSIDGVLFNKAKTLLIQCPGGRAGNYTIPNGVGSIASAAFASCNRLTSVTIPGSVTSISDNAFWCGPNLERVYFLGNPPSVGPGLWWGVNNATVYYLPGTTGWGTTFVGHPAMLWNPRVETGDVSFGVRTNQFGFTITGTSNLVLVVEACTNLINPSWSPVGTNALTGGSAYFSDPEWANHPVRFYRLRSP